MRERRDGIRPLTGPRRVAEFRSADSGHQVYESKGFSRRPSMDDGRPDVAAASAVMAVRVREVGKAWVTRSLGIALALCMALTVGGDVTLRGAGASRTKLVFTGTTPCDRGPPPYPVICIKGSFSWAGGVENSADWTAGYGKGTTVITLSNTANLRAGESFLILDQVDDTADGGDIYNCGIANGCVSQGSDGMRTAPGGYRNQRQIV